MVFLMFLQSCAFTTTINFRKFLPPEKQTPFSQVEVLCHLITVCHILRSRQALPQWPYHFTFLPAMDKGCGVSPRVCHTVVSLSPAAILTGVKQCLTVVSPCISLVANDVEHLSCACWPFVHLLGEMVTLKRVVLSLLNCEISLYSLEANACILWVFSLSRRCHLKHRSSQFQGSCICLFFRHCLCFGVVPTKAVPNSTSEGCNPIHSSKNSLVLALIVHLGATLRPYFSVYNAHPRFWPKLSGKKIFRFNF